ncbi:MAG: C45 family peptidase [Actinobacteria bacterium]|nr:C45 family peptidase [Actinomycetota bacterium]
MTKEHLPLKVVRGRNRYELGVSEAEAAGPGARAMTRWLSRSMRHDPDALDTVLRAARTRVEQLAGTEHLAELEGFAATLGLDTHDALCARVAAESCARLACTNFGAVGPATADGEPMVSWNFDVPPVFRLFMGRFPLFVRHLEGTNPYVCFGVPALFGIGIMNAAGLCCVVNAVPMTDAGDGLSPFELNNTAMETCATVDGAEEVFNRGPRGVISALASGVLMNWNTIWTDAAGSLSVFEYSHSHFHRRRAGDEGIMASTNHHQFLDSALSGCPDPTVLDWLHGSRSRLARMWALLRGFHGRIDPAHAKMIVSDHVPDYSTLSDFGIRREWWEEKLDDCTICAHAWNFRKHLREGHPGKALEEAEVSWTVYSLHVQPANMTVWLTDGHPCRNPTTPVYFGSALGVDAEPFPGALPRALCGRERVQSGRRGLFRRDMGPVDTAMSGAWMGFIRATEGYARKKLNPHA